MTAVLRPLRDDVPGWLGLLPDDDTVVHVEFAEHNAELVPQDGQGTLTSWRADVDAGLGLPGIDAGYTGPARVFAGNHGLVADDPSGRTLLTRDVTVQALVAWDAENASGTQTLVTRGFGDGLIEQRPWALVVRKIDTGLGELAWIWQDNSGTVREQPGGQFFAVEPDGFLLLTATREWARDRFLLRYWANDQLIASHESSDIEVGGGVGGHVTIGCAKSGADYTERFTGMIDQLAILRVAVPDEAVRHTYRRMAEFQPAAFAALLALQPRGRARTLDPGTHRYSDLRARAQAIGLAASLAERQRTDGLPSHAYGPQLRLWEELTGIQPRPGDTIAVRRTRVGVALLRQLGLSSTAVRTALAPFVEGGADNLQTIQPVPYYRLHQDDEFAWNLQGVDITTGQFTDGDSAEIAATAIRLMFTRWSAGASFRITVYTTEGITDIDAFEFFNRIIIRDSDGNQLAETSLGFSPLQVGHGYVRIRGNQPMTAAVRPRSPTERGMRNIVKVTCNNGSQAFTSDTIAWDPKSSVAMYPSVLVLDDSGEIDFASARAALHQQAAAHVEPTFCARSLRCDDEDHGCDDTPLKRGETL